MKIRNAYLEQWILCSYADSWLFFFTAICGFLLATLAVTCYGAPVERSILHHACGRAVRTEPKAGKPGGRHSLAKLICPVKEQMGIAVAYFKKENETINEYYKEVSFRLKWNGVVHKSKWNRLDFHGHRGLAARRSVICVCISWSYHHN